MTGDKKQIKSRERVEAHGEVFTAEREVKAMCDLVKPETERIDSRFLEPACGDGNFLIEILTRKLEIVKKKYRRSAFDYERMSLLALGSLYGVDILEDNAKQCRQRLYDYWNAQYTELWEKKKECNEDTRRSAQFILARNIVCGNALTLHCVDKHQQDTKEPIVFSEWAFPRNDAFMRRKDYTFDELLNGPEKTTKKSEEEPDLFSYFGQSLEQSAEPDDGSQFIRQYIAHYRRIWEHE